MRERAKVVPAAEEGQRRRVTLRRSALLFPALVMALLVPRQCPEGAAPEAGGGTPTSTVAPTEAGPVTLADVDPCQLLNEQTAPQVGIEDVATGEHRSTDTFRQCNWVQGETEIIVAVTDTLTLDQVIADLQGGTPTSVGSREAYAWPSPDQQSCTVYIRVGDASLAYGHVTGGADPCELAMQTAQLIEPELPGAPG